MLFPVSNVYGYHTGVTGSSAQVGGATKASKLNLGKILVRITSRISIFIKWRSGSAFQKCLPSYYVLAL